MYMQCTHMWCVVCAKALVALALAPFGIVVATQPPQLGTHKDTFGVGPIKCMCGSKPHVQGGGTKSCRPPQNATCWVFWGHAPIVWGVLGPRWVGGVVALL